jgi:hypothetical protein
MVKTVSLILTFTLLMACVSKKTIVKTEPQPPVENVERVSPLINQEFNPVYVFNQKCGSCHNPHNPADYTETEWKIIVPTMVNKANEKEITIGPGQQELILNYLLQNAKK